MKSATTYFTRFLDLGIPPYLARSALLGVVAQRLVRTLCPYCKQPGAIDPDEWRSLLGGHELAPPRMGQVPVGCDECRHTGYLGRVGIFEIMAVNDAVQEQITSNPDHTAISAAASSAGMKPLRISGAEKIASGLTTTAEVLTVVENQW